MLALQFCILLIIMKASFDYNNHCWVDYNNHCWVTEFSDLARQNLYNQTSLEPIIIFSGLVLFYLCCKNIIFVCKLCKLTVF